MIATNLASCYAASGHRTVLIDHDPQGTSLRWLSQRGEYANPIHGINDTARNQQVTRSFNMHLPPGTQCVVIDTRRRTRS